MPTFDSLKIDNTQYDVDLHSATFYYPLGESKGFCKAMTIPGFYGNWDNRQLFFILYGRHCPCALYIVKYQAGGSATINDANFEITCYGNFYGSGKTDIIFQKEQSGDSVVLNIYLNCYDYGNLSMWIAPRDITVYDHSSAEWVTAGDIPNQIPVKFTIDSDGGTIEGTLSLTKQLDFNNTTYSDINRLITFQNENAIGIDSGANCLTLFSKGSSGERQIVLNSGTGGQRTSLIFNRNTSFPISTARNVASEEWVNDSFLSKTSLSVSGTTLKIS